MEAGRMITPPYVPRSPHCGPVPWRAEHKEPYISQPFRSRANVKIKNRRAFGPILNTPWPDDPVNCRKRGAPTGTAHKAHFRNHHLAP